MRSTLGCDVGIRCSLPSCRGKPLHSVLYPVWGLEAALCEGHWQAHHYWAVRQLRP